VHGDGNGWVECDRGHRHWGRLGSAGLLLRWSGSDREQVLLQHRAEWSHHGGTWGLPGGARDSEESALQAALRETREETGLDTGALRVHAMLVDDHGSWSYTSVLATAPAPLAAAPISEESIDVRWVDTAEVGGLALHPGFAATWPQLRRPPAPLRLVVDAANVIGSRPDGWWRDRPGAVRRLRDALATVAHRGLPAAALPLDAAGLGEPTPDEPGPGEPGSTEPDAAPGRSSPELLVVPRIVLVVEGAARPVAADPAAGVDVVAAPGSGDDTIVAHAAADGREDVLVVTADRQLRDRVHREGAAVAGPRWLLDLL